MLALTKSSVITAINEVNKNVTDKSFPKTGTVPDFGKQKKCRPKAAFAWGGSDQTTAPSVSSFSLTGLIRSSRLTPSHMATAAATNTDE